MVTPWASLTVLVLGGTGLIGNHVVRALLRRGCRVRVLVRPSSSRQNLEGLAVEQVVGDLADPSSVENAIAGCDVLFHAAAPYPRGHFGRERQVAQAVENLRVVLAVARKRVPVEMLRLPRERGRWFEVEQAEGAAQALRLQPERAEDIRRAVRSQTLLDESMVGRLNASLHPPLAEVTSLPGLKRIVYVSSATTIGRPRGSPAAFRPRGRSNRAANAPPADGSEAIDIQTDRDAASTAGAVGRPANEDDRYELIRGSSPYFEMKAAMEAEVTRAAVEGMPIVIGNPTLCFDEHDSAPTTGKLMLAVAGRLPFYVDGIVNAVATRDVAEALVVSAEVGRTGQRYILGGENLSMRELIAMIAHQAGVPPPRLAIPVPLAEGVAWASEVLNLVLRRPWPLVPLSGVQMVKHSQPLDSTRARRELQMSETPLEIAIADAFRWFRANGYL